MNILSMCFRFKNHQFFSHTRKTKIIFRKYSDAKSIDIKTKDLSIKVDFLSEKIFQAPYTVDFNLNGACNLNCSWCWGP
jgi:sulfatase maturation enzyme AslB (radical SAM superfamily)